MYRNNVDNTFLGPGQLLRIDAITANIAGRHFLYKRISRIGSREANDPWRGTVEQKAQVERQNEALANDVHLDGAFTPQVEFLEGKSAYEGSSGPRGDHDAPHDHGCFSGSNAKLGLQIFRQERGLS